MIVIAAEHMEAVEKPAYYAYLPRRRPHAISGSDPNSTIYLVPDTNKIIVISDKVTRTSGSPVSAVQYVQFSQSIVTNVPEAESASTVAGLAPAIQGGDAPLAADIYALKRLSGLTWDGIAELVNSSRQAVHKWTQGGAITQSNRLRVSRLVAAMKSIDQGTTKETLAFLGTAMGNRTLYDRLREGHFDEIASAYGESAVVGDESWGKVVPRLGEPSAFQTQLNAVAYEDVDVIQPVQTKPIRRFRMKMA